MSSSKIGTKILNDAPFENINFFTMSFIDPVNYEDAEDIPDAKFLTTKGFIVYDGYNLSDQAKNNAKEIKETFPHHDITVGDVGKVHEWNDRENAEEIEYSRKELNDMERARRDNAEKLKVVSEQMQNDKFKPGYRSKEVNEREKRKERVLKKLLSEGKITIEEYNAKLNNIEIKPKKKISGEDFLAIYGRAQEEMKTDNLPEYNNSTFKFGCISFYDPTIFKGLTKFCFKVRGLCQTPEEIDERITKLKKLYPYDPIHKFEIGKWCALPGPSTIDPNVELNYLMKLHNDHVKVEKQQFDERKSKMLADIEKEKAATKANQATASEPKEKPKSKSFVTESKTTLFNADDKPMIDKLRDFLQEDASEPFNIKTEKAMQINPDGTTEDIGQGSGKTR